MAGKQVVMIWNLQSSSAPIQRESQQEGIIFRWQW